MRCSATSDPRSKAIYRLNAPSVSPEIRNHRIAALAFGLAIGFWGSNAAALETPAQSAEQPASVENDETVPAKSVDEPPPPERADVEPSPQGFSAWDIQIFCGTNFTEPGVSEDVAKWTWTVENSSAWSWGSSYFFIDYLKSDSADQNATEYYGE